MATSRDPPAEKWSLPAVSKTTPIVGHFAAHSTFHGNLPAPLYGLICPSCPQPLAHLTKSGIQRLLSSSVSLSHA